MKDLRSSVPPPDSRLSSVSERIDRHYTERAVQIRRFWWSIGLSMCVTFGAAYLVQTAIHASVFPDETGPRSLGWILRIDQEPRLDGISVAGIALALAGICVTFFVATSIDRAASVKGDRVEEARTVVIDAISFVLFMVIAIACWSLAFAAAADGSASYAGATLAAGTAVLATTLGALARVSEVTKRHQHDRNRRTEQIVTAAQIDLKARLGRRAPGDVDEKGLWHALPLFPHLLALGVIVASSVAVFAIAFFGLWSWRSVLSSVLISVLPMVMASGLVVAYADASADRPGAGRAVWVSVGMIIGFWCLFWGGLVVIFAEDWRSGSLSLIMLVCPLVALSVTRRSVAVGRLTYRRLCQRRVRIATAASRSARATSPASTMSDGARTA